MGVARVRKIGVSPYKNSFRSDDAATDVRGPLCDRRAVVRELRATSATGHIRLSHNPNVRRQDGFWDYLLCADCEQRLGRWERDCAELLFKPYLRGCRRMVRYGSWLSRFAVSLVWRVLAVYRENGLSHPVISNWTVTDDAEAAWRACLQGQRANPGEFEVHMLALDYVTNVRGPVPPNLNHFLMRSFTFDVLAASEDDIVVYTKLPAFACFGFVKPNNEPGDWCNTRLGFGGGVIGRSDTRVPHFVWETLHDGAVTVDRKMRSISGRQRRRIDESLAADPDRWLASGTIEVMEHDLMLSKEE